MAPSKADERPRIIISIGFVPAIIESKPEDYLEKYVQRENARLENQVSLLNNNEQLRQEAEFREVTSETSSSPLRIENMEKPWIDEELFERYLREHSTLGKFLGPSPANEVTYVVTNGSLIDDSLAIKVGRSVLISIKPLASLTSKLMRDPWPALAVFFFIKVYEGLDSIRSETRA